MAVEVISLISSSDAGSPPRLTSRHLPPANAPPPRAFDSDDLPTAPAFSGRNGGPSRLKSKPSAPIVADDVCLISDDEPHPSSHGRQLAVASVDGPAPKRRRVVSPAFGDCFRSEPLRAFGSRRLSSTAGRLAEAGRPLHNTERPKSRGNWLDDDPFASSSPLVAERALPSANSQHGDPFATSSPQPRQPKEPQPAKTSTKPTVIDEVNSFASDSPGQACRPSKSDQTAAAWDPISSSVPLPADNEPSHPPPPFRKAQSEVIDLGDSDEDGKAHPDSDDEFPDITGLPTAKHRVAFLPMPSNVFAAAKPSGNPKSAAIKPSSVKPKRNALEKEKEREDKAAAREAEKERKRLEKEHAREEKAQEKARAAALAEVNKIRTDKKVSTPEMIVDLPATLHETVKLQTETLLHDLDVRSTSWPSPVENVVKWRRKVRSRYNDDLGHWEPIEERIEQENYAMVIIPAAQLVDLVLGKDSASLESHVLSMKRSFPKDTIIYLIEGLASWMRKNRNVRNRQFVSAVRNGLDPVEEAPPTSQLNQAQRRRKDSTAQAQAYIDEEAVEDALLQLQVLHNLLIHHTTAAVETARWISIFTQHISTVPYRRQRDHANDAGFCMETGQVRTGDSAHDTYVRMLQEIGRVTAPIAYGIAAEFGTVSKLVRGLEEGGPLRLEKVKKSVNKEGEASERTVGQAVSRRVFKIFTGRDESSTDI